MTGDSTSFLPRLRVLFKFFGDDFNFVAFNTDLDTPGDGDEVSTAGAALISVVFGIGLSAIINTKFYCI